VARAKKSQIREQIKQDLTDQLERQGVYGRHFLDLIEDYMALWDTKNALISDIKKRGVMIKYQNGENQWGYKKNDSECKHYLQKNTYFQPHRLHR